MIVIVRPEPLKILCQPDSILVECHCLMSELKYLLELEQKEYLKVSGE